MTVASNVPHIELEGKWSVRVPATGYKSADGHRVCTNVIVYPGGPWVSFTWLDPARGPVQMFISRPCVLEPFHDERKPENAMAPPRELPGLRAALANDPPPPAPPLRRGSR